MLKKWVKQKLEIFQQTLHISDKFSQIGLVAKFRQQQLWMFKILINMGAF